MSEPPVPIHPDSMVDRLEQAPQSLLLGAAFVLGAVVGSTVTLLARGDDDTRFPQIRRALRTAVPAAPEKRPSETLKQVLTEEAVHVVRAVGTQLAEAAAEQVRDYVVGAWFGRGEDGEHDEDEEELVGGVDYPAEGEDGAFAGGASDSHRSRDTPPVVLSQGER